MSKVTWSEAKWKRVLRASVPRWFPMLDARVSCAFCKETGHEWKEVECPLDCPAVRICDTYANTNDQDDIKIHNRVRSWLRRMGKKHGVPMPGKSK